MKVLRFNSRPLLQWLVEKTDSVFVGLNDYGIQMSDSRLTYTVDTLIHHVKNWGSVEENFCDSHYSQHFEDIEGESEEARKERYRKQTITTQFVRSGF